MTLFLRSLDADFFVVFLQARESHPSPRKHAFLPHTRQCATGRRHAKMISAMAVELLIMRKARITFAKTLPGTTVDL